MSEHITHLAICDDVFRLAALHPGIHGTFKELMTSERVAAHMGAVTRSADLWSAELIDWSRGQLPLPKAERDAHAVGKLAFVLGALTHRSADRHMKPIIRCWDDPAERREATIHMDIFTFREVYGAGRGPHAGPFGGGELEVAATPAEERFEEYYRVVMRRALIAMHTFAPDRENVQAWLTAFFDRLQTFPLDLRQHARIAAEWDPDKVRRYLVEKRFYGREDPLISAARRLQHGDTATSDEVLQAVESTTKANSRYARALRRALEYLLSATQLFGGQISLEEAKKAFDVGVPELAMTE